MATREVVTQAQREYFYELSDRMSERERIRYYTLSEEDIQIIRQQRGATNQLGFAVQLAYLRFPGRPFASGEKIPDFLVSLLAKRLGIVSAAIHHYAKIRDTTRREHIGKIRKHFGFRSFTLREYRELANWLLPTAMGTDKGLVLVDLVIQEMRKRKIILPAMYAIEHLVWAVCERAERRTFKKLTKALSPQQLLQLDQLLTKSADKHITNLSWLRKPPGTVSLKNFHKILDRIQFIQKLALPLENGQEIHQNRLLQLAREGSRYSTQHLSRFHSLKGSVAKFSKLS